MIHLHHWTTPNGHQVTMFHARAAAVNTAPTVSPGSAALLFGQTAATAAKT